MANNGQTFLVTGGAGYIGVHMSALLLELGHKVVIFDNLANSSRAAIERLCKVSGRKMGEAVVFYEGDVRDRGMLDSIFTAQRIHGVLHFAGLKAVGESVAHPLSYYDTNVHGSITLISAMQAHGIHRLAFSSSATVYGKAAAPMSEDTPLAPFNPYGHSKAQVERILTDHTRAYPEMKVAILRYFNPVGAHASGDLGEAPNGEPNNLFPYILQVAAGLRPKLRIFGDDYATPDGTGVRDYIHVWDLVKGHMAALNGLDLQPSGEPLILNLGTGKGYSVLEMVKVFAKVNSVAVPYEIAPRRAGDIDTCFANTMRAKTKVFWEATLGLEAMCLDAWRWQTQNPNGYN